MASSLPRINWVEIQGFRAFGKISQRLDFSSSISVLWGPNSQGKTSLAEALEFLFTGAIVRKDILASGQDEFADSLRNTHLPSGVPVFVAAEVLDTARVPHVIRRTLASDFGKKTNCTSTLEIDGKPAAEDGFAKIGIRLSQPPMAVPILMQHTLGYLFSAKPSERSIYFKGLLQVDDLELLRNTISNREAALQKADTPLITKLRRAAVIDNQDVRNSLAPLLELDEMPPNISLAIADAFDLLLLHEGFNPPEELATKIQVIESLLQQKQAVTFPIAQFKRGPFVPAVVEDDPLEVSLGNLHAQSQKVDSELKQLTNLFAEVLKVPAVASTTSAVDCPVCGTADALTPERIQIIRDQLEASHSYVEARASAQSFLRQLTSRVTGLEANVRAALPNFRSLPRKQRTEIGFSVERIRSLLPEDHQERLQTWLRELRLLLRAAKTLHLTASRIRQMAKQDTEIFANNQPIEEIRSSIVQLREQQTQLVAREKIYANAEQTLKDALQSVVDVKSSTTGWRELLDIAADQRTLSSDLIDMKARAVVKGELAKAVQKIDRAREEVMNDKFASMSGEIEGWWERLRPDEPVFFSGVKSRPQTVRTIDFKASLAATSERLNPHVRDVIAIFSVSQMHCLGLAAFLARAVREKSGFVILDDPILSSDDDHRTNFVHGGLQALIDGGFQVILLTQDQRLRKTLGDLYAYREIDLFEITMPTPAEGCEVNKTSDSISAMLARAKPFIGSQSLELRKSACEKLRDVAERVCKEIIVNGRRKNGDTTADITEYTDRKGTLDFLLTEIEAYLTDNSHPGKLRVIAQTLNPGKHDDDVPAKEALRQANGDLLGFKKQYSLS